MNIISKLPGITGLLKYRLPYYLGNSNTMACASESIPHKDASPTNIVWIDMEMTGLDIDNDKILELACVITDKDLNVIGMGPDMIFHESDDVLNSMNDWCLQHHGQSGLIEASRKTKKTVKEGEIELLEFVKKYAPYKKCPVAGNSVYLDRIFLIKHMPNLNDHFHYRIIDVSSIKELSKRWFKKEHAFAPHKKFKHRALDDILDSIEELKYYRKTVFRDPAELNLNKSSSVSNT